MSQFELQGDADQTDAVPGDEHLDGNEPPRASAAISSGWGSRRC